MFKLSKLWYYRKKIRILWNKKIKRSCINKVAKLEEQVGERLAQIFHRR